MNEPSLSATQLLRSLLTRCEFEVTAARLHAVRTGTLKTRFLNEIRTIEESLGALEPTVSAKFRARTIVAAARRAEKVLLTARASAEASATHLLAIAQACDVSVDCISDTLCAAVASHRSLLPTYHLPNRLLAVACPEASSLDFKDIHVTNVGIEILESDASVQWRSPPEQQGDCAHTFVGFVACAGKAPASGPFGADDQH